MVNIKYYTKVFFNEETGKERWSLIPKEAENICKNNSVENCWNIAMECYDCELFYMQMMGVYILGLIGNKKSLNFLKNTVSKNPSWQVKEFLAMAFDKYCERNGYENSL
ncbi:MAG: hypothetical protein LBG80_20460, partial [Bacteroidales bacterium]|nr:hypothetical protein [Bacteroidales bacterium]